jgi:hypothetical protein
MGLRLFCVFRFSDTRCIVSTRKILKGEEITVNYGYNMKSKKIPRCRGQPEDSF